MKSFCLILCAVFFLSAPHYAHSDPHASQSSLADYKFSKIKDIQLSFSTTEIKLLLFLSEQPQASSAIITSDGFDLYVKGLSFSDMIITPQESNLVTSLKTKSLPDRHSSLVSFQTRKLRSVTTENYKNALLVTAILQTPLPPKTRKLDVPTPKNVSSPTESARPFQEHFNLDQSQCNIAKEAVKNDEWDMAALSKLILCDIGLSSLHETDEKLSQLESFDPENWRGKLARAEYLRLSNELNAAKHAFNQAILASPTPKMKRKILDWMMMKGSSSE